ncbi:MAG TPA: hypothetical protein VGC11_03540 [Acidimicrobiia bacterium]
MKKFLSTLAIAGLAGGLFAGVAAAGHETTLLETDIGTLDTDEESYIEADGAEGNSEFHDSLDGYIVLSEERGGVCGGDEGSFDHGPDAEPAPDGDGVNDSESCNEEFVEAILGNIPA